jgi:hypothetical protein
MKRVIDTSEVLGTIDLSSGSCELCAAADANYDEETHQLVIRLNSFLRTTDLRSKEKQMSANWLPHSETVVESVGSDEALELARDIFHRWVRKVRATAPSLHSSTF